jgi:transcriptional regulator with XRE-family HTH domain
MASETSRVFGFGKRLKTARDNKKMTGEQFGKGLQGDGKDATKQTISDWENERHLPNVLQLREMCLRLAVSADYLLFGEGGMTPAMLEAHSAMLKLTPEQRRTLMVSLPTESEAEAGYRNAVEESKPREQRQAGAKRTPKKRKKPE